jgi:hypothetical protein
VLISSLRFQDLPTLVALRSNGYQLLVLSPDPIEHEHKLLGKSRVTNQAARIARLERDFLLHQIQLTGARVVEWQVDQPFMQIANAISTPAPLWDRNQVIAHA